MRLLVIEDEPKVARALETGPERAGYRAVVAPTGEDGFYLATAQSFDLILLDLMLPGRDGLEILNALRRLDPWAAFAGTDDEAVVDGDFAMLEGELQGVLKALRKADINIVAIHHHMAGETPRLLFLHYWGRGPSAALARGLRAALDTQKEAR